MTFALPGEQGGDDGRTRVGEESWPTRGPAPSEPGTALVVDGRRAFAKRPRRVPADAFVSVAGHLLEPPPTRLRLAGPAPAAVSANDNATPAGGSTRRILRELLFFAILALTVVGAFYSGRLHAFQRVIVVPAPSSGTSIIT